MHAYFFTLFIVIIFLSNLSAPQFKYFCDSYLSMFFVARVHLCCAGSFLCRYLTLAGLQGQIAATRGHGGASLCGVGRRVHPRLSRLLSTNVVFPRWIQRVWCCTPWTQMPVNKNVYCYFKELDTRKLTATISRLMCTAQKQKQSFFFYLVLWIFVQKWNP